MQHYRALGLNRDEVFGMSEVDAAATVAKLQAGNFRNLVSTDGGATYDFRVGGRHAEISKRATGREEDTLGKIMEGLTDLFGENGAYYTAAALGTASLGKLIAGGWNSVFKSAKKVSRWMNNVNNPNSPHPSVHPSIAPATANIANTTSAMTAPVASTLMSSSSSGNSGLGGNLSSPHTQGGGNHTSPNSSISKSSSHFKTPAGFVERESGLIVPESVEKSIAKNLAKETAETGVKSFLKKIPLVGLLASMAFAGERAIEGDFTGAGLELASGAAGTIPGIGTAASLGIDGYLMARDAGVVGNAFNQTTGMSISAANAIHSPITPQDVNQSFQAQLHGFYQQEAIKRSVENMEQFKAFTHPVAPVPGITLQTQVGEIGFSKTYEGYLTIGGRETAIPYSDFQQQMSANDGYMVTQITSAISQSQISQNNIEQMLPNVGNMRTTEELLMSIRQSSSAQSMDTRIGTSELIEQTSVNTEIMEEMADALNKMKEKMGAE